MAFEQSQLNDDCLIVLDSSLELSLLQGKSEGIRVVQQIDLNKKFKDESAYAQLTKPWTPLVVSEQTIYVNGQYHNLKTSFYWENLGAKRGHEER